jgi:hypothetical protein
VLAYFKTTFLDGSNLYQSTEIRSLQENEIRKIDEDETEFIGIINYSIMALIQLELGVADQPDLSVEKATKFTMPN